MQIFTFSRGFGLLLWYIVVGILVHALISDKLLGIMDTIDVEKLIHLVQERRPLWDHSCKEYHNKDRTDQLWAEVSAELDVGGDLCKKKFANLRNQYNRELRKTGGSGVPDKKPWYLMPYLNFLFGVVNQYRTGSSNGVSDNDLPHIFETENPDSPLILESYENISTGNVQQNTQQNFKKRKTVTETVAEPMIEYFKRKTELLEQPKTSRFTSSNMKFLESLEESLNNLSRGNQRKFKIKVMELMNELEEEDEITNASNILKKRSK